MCETVITVLITFFPALSRDQTRDPTFILSTFTAPSGVAISVFEARQMGHIFGRAANSLSSQKYGGGGSPSLETGGPQLWMQTYPVGHALLGPLHFCPIGFVHTPA